MEQWKCEMSQIDKFSQNQRNYMLICILIRHPSFAFSNSIFKLLFRPFQNWLSLIPKFCYIGHVKKLHYKHLACLSTFLLIFCTVPGNGKIIWLKTILVKPVCKEVKGSAHTINKNSDVNLGTISRQTLCCQKHKINNIQSYLLGAHKQVGGLWL